jgi:hypothetical protein
MRRRTNKLLEADNSTEPDGQRYFDLTQRELLLDAARQEGHDDFEAGRRARGNEFNHGVGEMTLRVIVRRPAPLP